MNAFERLTLAIETANAASGGVLLPVVAGLTVLIAFAALSWMWRRVRRIPDPPNKVERILAEDAAQRPMTCEEFRAYFGLDGVHDVFPEEER